MLRQHAFRNTRAWGTKKLCSDADLIEKIRTADRRVTGCTADQLASAISELKDRGRTYAEIKAIGFQPSVIRQAGYTCADAYAHEAGMTLKSARQSCTGDELEEILRASKARDNLSPEDAIDAGYTLEELIRVGYSPEEVANGYIRSATVLATVSILKKLKAAGLTCAEAKRASFRPKPCMEAGFTFEEAKAAGYAFFEMHWKRGDETESVVHNGWELDA